MKGHKLKGGKGEAGATEAGAGRKVELIRWTIERAASEFGLNRKTVTERIKRSGTLPGADGKFSTAAMHAAICGDYERERVRKISEEADAAAIANAESRGDLVDKADFVRRLEPIYSEMRQRIMSSSLKDAEKDALLGELCKLHSV